MGLETAAYISDLVITNPPASDKRKQGDDHLRLIKNVLKSTLPNANRAFRIPEVGTTAANYNVVAAEENKILRCNTGGGNFTVTLPATGTLFAGWQVWIVKTSGDVNAVFVAPASGNILSGDLTVSKVRRAVPGVVTSFLWTGNEWIAERAPGAAAVGEMKDFGGAGLPVGFEWAAGGSLLRADYPELFARFGTIYGAADGTHFSLPDLQGRVTAGKDDMSGVSAGRLNDFTSTTLGAAFGEQHHTLIMAELPVVTPAGTVTKPNITVTDTKFGTAGVRNDVNNITVLTAGGSSLGITAALDATPVFNGAAFGSGNSHNNVQPSFVANKIIVAE